MTTEARATITVDDKVVTFEGPQGFVDVQVAKYIASGLSSDSQTNKTSDTQSSDLTTRAVLTEKQLVLAKKPDGHSETIAVLAFALAESGVSEFSEEDMRKAYIRAGVRPPKVVGQAIRDSKRLNDFVDYGSQRGRYKLSNHGDRTVRFDLPRQTETKG
jgi:hypothetical protein